ncbi:hypothetical protein H0H92_004004 [Tricholoma furcatifolium]|nr:hypothetical protein H0H92_004004 [Tricholoma furcatifolium]
MGNANKVVSQRQIASAFLQESIRQVAAGSRLTLALSDSLSVEEITKQAFEYLGENGIIRSAEKHSCSECTQKFKSKADFLTPDDPAAVVRVDENQAVPPLQGEDAALAVNDAAHARRSAAEAMDIDDEEEDNNKNKKRKVAPVKMIVMDGIVMGPTHCAFENCSEPLVNARRAVFCANHQILMFFDQQLEMRLLVAGGLDGRRLHV